MAAIGGLADPFARIGLTLLRGTGIRLGELLDLELDCVWDTGSHGSWLKVPLGKLGTERQTIRRSSFTSVRELTAAIGAFIDHWNDHPIPFTWTKDADQLLGKIARAKTETIGLTDYQVVSQLGSRESYVLEVSTYRMTQAAVVSMKASLKFMNLRRMSKLRLCPQVRIRLAIWYSMALLIASGRPI